MENPLVAFLLAVAAGSMDGYTYFVGKTFSTVQSGNIILLGQTIATEDWHHLSIIGLTILCFGLGAAFTGFIEFLDTKEKKRSWTFRVILIEVIVLIALGFKEVNGFFHISIVCMMISFLAGMQGNAFHKINGMLYGNVAVTLVVQLAFNYLMQFFLGSKGALKLSLLFFLILLGFALGGMLGTFTTNLLQEKSLWVTAGILVVIALFVRTLSFEDDNKEPVDPS